MEKTEMMKRYEAETGKDRPTVNIYSLIDWYEAFSEWLESKAEAYDRLMGGGKKTLKEWANIFGKPVVVDSDDTILVFSSVPLYEGGYSQEGDYVDDWIGEVIAHIDCAYEGDYVDDVTLPDGWETKGENK